MTRRIPLWLALAPLIMGLGIYAVLWRGWAEDFRAELASIIPVESLELSGFPYRLEANVDRPRLQLGETLKLNLAATSARINRGPWKPELSVINLQNPSLSVSASPALTMRVAAKNGIASINWGEGRLRRQSNVLQAAQIRIAGIPAISVDTLETHLRELSNAVAPATSPTDAARGQLVLSGQRLSIGGGAALSMAAELLATAPARLSSYDRWANTGSVELKRLALADAHGEILSATATLVPQGGTNLIVAGTLITVCPATVAAALAGTPAPPERRLRLGQRIAFKGPLGAITLAPLPDLSSRARQGQVAYCPRIRGSDGEKPALKP